MVQWLRTSLEMWGHRFDAWSGKIPHASGQLGPGTTTGENPTQQQRSSTAKRKKKKKLPLRNYRHSAVVLATPWEHTLKLFQISVKTANKMEFYILYSEIKVMLIISYLKDCIMLELGGG